MADTRGTKEDIGSHRSDESRLSKRRLGVRAPGLLVCMASLLMEKDVPIDTRPIGRFESRETRPRPTNGRSVIVAHDLGRPGDYNGLYFRSPGLERNDRRLMTSPAVFGAPKAF